MVTYYTGWPPRCIAPFDTYSRGHLVLFYAVRAQTPAKRIGYACVGCKIVYTPYRVGDIYVHSFLVGFVCTGRNTNTLRILIANTPRMYRESLALSIYQNRPDFEVLVAVPNELDGNVERLSPHVLVRDDDGVEMGAPDGVVCWVGIKIDDHLNARISVNGKTSELHDVSLEEFLTALGETEELIFADGVQAEPSPEA